jgi:hypothetical protein
MLITSLKHLHVDCCWGKVRLAKPVASVRVVSILLGVIVGSVLAFAYQANLPTLFFEINVASLVVFAAIPLLAGFLVGVLHPPTGVRDGLLVGLLTGLVNSIIATVKLIFAEKLATGEVYAFALFAVMSVFIWMILGAAVAALASRLYE